MGTFGHFVILLALVLPQNPSGGAGESKAASCPALPHFDWNACPFEGCTYRQWTAHEVVPVYDTWKENRRQVTQLAVGDQVVAITGVVITYKPGVIQLDEDIPRSGFKRGDIILTYTYHGEGESAVCFKGKYYANFNIQFSKSPGGSCGSSHCEATYVHAGKCAWWAKVKLKSGRTGWVDMTHAKFGNVDRFG